MFPRMLTKLFAEATPTLLITTFIVILNVFRVVIDLFHFTMCGYVLLERYVDDHWDQNKVNLNRCPVAWTEFKF